MSTKGSAPALPPDNPAMVHLLVVAHAPLASALSAVAAHTYPCCDSRLRALDILPEWGLDRAVAEIARALPESGPVLVLADVPGATPANAAAQALQGRPEAALVHGVNVPMLWRTLCYGSDGLEALAQRAVEGGIRGVGQA